MKRGFLLAMASALTVFVVALAFAAMSLAGSAKTTRVSVNSAGEQGNGSSSSFNFDNSISANGRFVAFVSAASNLVAGDTNRTMDTFVHNRRNGKTTRVSVSSTGEQGNGVSIDPSISAGGRYVAFEFRATTLVPGDHNGVMDIFVHDRRTRKTTRISVSSAGAEANNTSTEASISADGRYVAFVSEASNLVRGHNDLHREDVFVRDLKARKTKLVSQSSTGERGRRRSYGPSISADGRYVAFWSLAGNLVRGDTNRQADVFVRDLKARKTKLVSRSSTGKLGNNASTSTSISANGRYVAFWSLASNLVRRDTNGRPDVFVRDLKAHRTKRVSLSSTEKQANNARRGIAQPSISANGRFVAFSSSASNLVRRDTNRSVDVFVRDRRSGKTKRVSLSRTGNQGNDKSSSPSISARGSFVAFASLASNLVRSDTNGQGDIFVRGPGR